MSDHVTSAHVLVVDDYTDSREMYVDFLVYCGFRVSAAKDGPEALARAHDDRPDVILMDLSMPGIDGWEVTRRLKEDARTRNIPVIALTGHALAADAERAYRAGCDAFVTKPCLPDDLVAQVRRILGQRTTPGPAAAVEKPDYAVEKPGSRERA